MGDVEKGVFFRTGTDTDTEPGGRAWVSMEFMELGRTHRVLRLEEVRV